MINKNIRSLGKMILGTIMAASLAGIIMQGIRISETTRKYQEAAEYISHQEYIPIGNGGAFGEFYGHIGLERRKMYDRIHRIYFEKMNCYPPNLVTKEAEILKDPNLTKEQKDSMIRDLYPYIFRR